MSCHFLRLPREIRYMIYRYLSSSRSGTINLSYSRTIHGRKGSGHVRDCSCTACEGWPLACTCKQCDAENLPTSVVHLRVCHQMHDEAVPILYSENKFAFRHAVKDEIPLFCQTIGTAAYNSIKHVYLHIDWRDPPYDFYFLDALAGFRNLENLTLSQNEVMPKRALNILSGFRLKSFTVQDPKGKHSPQLDKITDLNSPRTWRQLRRAHESKDMKFSRFKSEGFEWYSKNKGRRC